MPLSSWQRFRSPVQRKLFLMVVLMIVAVMPALGSDGRKAPDAKKLPHKTEIHGQTLVDDYFWMRDKANPEVKAYLDAENAYTESVMKTTEPLQKKLYDEILSRIKETDLGVPYRFGKHYYYSRTEKGLQYPILARKEGSLEAKEQVTLDLNELAKGEKFFSLGAFEVSDDGNLVAYTTDTVGFRQYTLQVKDLRTGKVLPDRVEKVDAVVWAADNKTLFYVVEDAAKRAYRLYRHVLGATNDDLLYEETDALYRINVDRSRSGGFIFLTSGSSETSEVRALDASNPTAAFKLIAPREEGHEYYADHHGDRFFIRTNKGAKNYRVVTAPVSDPKPANWKEVLPHDPASRLERFDLFKNHAVATERASGLPRLRVIDLATMKQHLVAFEEPVYALFPERNLEFDTNTVRFGFQSFITPSSVYDYDMTKKTKTLLKKTEVPGGYDSSKYATERIFATAADGTKVPVSLLYRKGMKRDGKNPVLLYGYGSYGYPLPITFSPARFSLIDRGVVYATAHVRGGGDMGEEWHDHGKMMEKKNTFTDFIAAAKQLIKDKLTAKEQIIISGGSAGGLLVGATVNLSPDLFKGVIAAVPFVDVTNTMLDETLPLTVGEFLEWGNPKIKSEYDYIKSYDPYTNIAAKKYPPMLVKTSWNDSQVMYWEAAKYVAKLRAMKTDENVLLLKVNMNAGHGGASGRYDALKETAFEYAWILRQFGLTN